MERRAEDTNKKHWAKDKEILTITNKMIGSVIHSKMLQPNKPKTRFYISVTTIPCNIRISAINR